MTINVNGRELLLLYEKALYLPGERLLVIADVHLGKAAHFRRGGVSISRSAQDQDFARLATLLDRVEPLKVYFLGDLFHSHINSDWHDFCELIKMFPSIRFTLVKGNHDIIDRKLFGELCIDVVDEIEDDVFLYTHEPMEDIPTGKLNIVGHIHPGYVLSGIARQSMKLPCFYMDDQQLILPAFGVLTGLYSMEKAAGAAIYLVLPDAVKRI